LLTRVAVQSTCFNSSDGPCDHFVVEPESSPAALYIRLGNTQVSAVRFSFVGEERRNTVWTLECRHIDWLLRSPASLVRVAGFEFRCSLMAQPGVWHAKWDGTSPSDPSAVTGTRHWHVGASDHVRDVSVAAMLHDDGTPCIRRPLQGVCGAQHQHQHHQRQHQQQPPPQQR